METRTRIRNAQNEPVVEETSVAERGAVGKWLDTIRRTDGTKLLWLIALIVIVTRLLFYLVVFEGYKDDYGWLRDDNYDEIAVNVLAGHGYVTEPGGEPNTTRTPLYTYFLVLHFMIFGDSRIAIVLVQSLLQAGACLLLYKIARDYSSDKAVGLLAALGLALYPQSMLYASQYLTESLYLLVMVLMIHVYFRITGVRGRGSFLVLGALLGLLTLCKPISQFMIVPVAVVIVSRFWDRKWYACKGIGMVVLGFIVILSPWTLRNYIVTGDVIPVSTMGGRFLYSNTIESLKEEEEALKELEGEEISSPGEEESKWFEFAMRNILDKPGRFLKNTLRTGLDFWYRGHSRSISIFNSLVNFPILLFGILGMVVARKRKLALLPALAIILYFNGVYSLLHAISRYSLPVIPIVWIFAVIGILHVAGQFVDREHAG